MLKILDAARSDNSFNLKFAAVIVVACSIVIGVHYKYFYNSVAGPFPLDASLALDPGPRELVRLKGELHDTGVVEQTVTRHFHVVETGRKDTAQFVTTELDGRPFLIKIPNDFVGDVVTGRLTPLTFKLGSLLPATPAPYPWTLDATETSYRIPSLPVGIAMLLLFPSLFWLRSAWRRSKNVESHPELVKLATLGPLPEMIARIENDVSAAGVDARIGELWLTPSWIVKPSLLHIWPAKDVIGVGRELTGKPVANKPRRHQVVIWRRGEPSPHTCEMPETTVTAFVERASVCMPWAVVDDSAAFRADWKSHRESLEQGTDTRRAAAT